MQNTCIAVKGQFHAFQLAAALEKNEMLNRLITTYPKKRAQQYGIAKKHIQSLLWHELLNQAWQRFAPKLLKQHIDPTVFMCELFDHITAHMIPDDTDLMVAWSSSALHTINAAKKRGIKTILERGSTHMLFAKHTLEEEYERMGIKNMSIVHPKIVERECAEYDAADYISIPSTFVYNTFVDQGVDPSKLIKTPYGVDVSHFSPGEKKDDVFRIIFCGARCVRKGIYYLLKAFTELDLPNSELWLIGSTSLDGEIILKQFQSEKIKLKGPFPQFELNSYYQQGSVFCLPSIEEGMGMVISQAMACGLPIICTKNTIGDDLVRDHQEGFVINIRDIDQLKEKILFFYEHPEETKQFGKAAHQRIQSGFSWEDYGDRIVKAYKALA